MSDFSRKLIGSRAIRKEVCNFFIAKWFYDLAKIETFEMGLERSVAVSGSEFDSFLGS